MLSSLSLLVESLERGMGSSTLEVSQKGVQCGIDRKAMTYDVGLEKAARKGCNTTKHISDI